MSDSKYEITEADTTAPEAPDASNWEIYHLLKQTDDQVNLLYGIVSEMRDTIARLESQIDRMS